MILCLRDSSDQCCFSDAFERLGQCIWLPVVQWIRQSSKWKTCNEMGEDRRKTSYKRAKTNLLELSETVPNRNLKLNLVMRESWIDLARWLANSVGQFMLELSYLSLRANKTRPCFICSLFLFFPSALNGSRSSCVGSCVYSCVPSIAPQTNRQAGGLRCQTNTYLTQIVCCHPMRGPS